ncbi:hypothetical protein JSO19_07495 [Leucobacter sp. UCMA 4100]|uniref:hypothetical protein n=1 Tax=Leucobacter sp. UCMA 4100 TaxID=2810534 RepID=UPI0022EA91EC|nr:hypothetical protein [Leucobacter sp. UCMA 4100]MDA3147222.1 hypothetical protein [Leucobacter sp. UCMA 4100]
MTAPIDRAAVLDFIRRDAAAGRLAAWGRSTVIDENTGVPSFDEQLFAELHVAAGIDADFPVGNAGLLHVYGYWFSHVMTPYGLKRERWLDGKLAAALGLPTDAFHLHDRGATTPLERVMNATLALLTDAPEGALVAEAPLDAAADALALAQTQLPTKPAADRPTPTPLAPATGPGPDLSPAQGLAPNRGLARRSRVVCLPARDGHPAVLVYGVEAAGAHPTMQLVTVFPFQGDPSGVIADFARTPRYRWNVMP